MLTYAFGGPQEAYYRDDDILYNVTHPATEHLDRVIRKTFIAQQRWWDSMVLKVQAGEIDEYTEQVCVCVGG